MIEKKTGSNLTVEAKSVDEAWLESIKIVINNGSWYHDGNFPILEYLGLNIRISNVHNGIQIIKDIGDIEVLERMICKFSANAKIPNAPFTYGNRLYELQGINQIQWIIDRLTRKPETKSATICLLIPGDSSDHIPCLTTLDAKIRHGKLHLSFFFRSQNIFGRQYANLYALKELQMDLCNQLNVLPGYILGTICSAHIYGFDVIEAEEILKGERHRIIDKYRRIGPDV
jgi:thymidylate synthase